MKKTFIILAIITLMVGIILTGYRSSTQKQKVVQADMLYTKRDLNAAQKEANTVTQKSLNAEEWITFKRESELKISEYEIRINELKIRMKTQGEKSDALCMKNIDRLEEQNKYSKARLVNYEKGPGNWESFKYGFNHEMDAIENALNDLTVDNKN